MYWRAVLRGYVGVERVMRVWVGDVEWYMGWGCECGEGYVWVRDVYGGSGFGWGSRLLSHKYVDGLTYSMGLIMYTQYIMMKNLSSQSTYFLNPESIYGTIMCIDRATVTLYMVDCRWHINVSIYNVFCHFISIIVFSNDYTVVQYNITL